MSALTAVLTFSFVVALLMLEFDDRLCATRMMVNLCPIGSPVWVGAPRTSQVGYEIVTSFTSFVWKLFVWTDLLGGSVIGNDPV